MGLFGMFGGKKGGAVAEEGEMSPGMVNMLAGMPGMMRKQMMKGRLSQLLTLSEDKRQQAILGMFGSFHSDQVKVSNREKVIATRNEVIGELTGEQRSTIMASRMAALKQRPELEQADQQVTEKVMSGVPEKARAAFMTTLKSLQDGSRD